MIYKDENKILIKTKEIDKRTWGWLYIIPTENSLKLLKRVYYEYNQNHTWGEIIYLYDIDENLNVKNERYIGKYYKSGVTSISAYGENIFISSTSSNITVINTITNKIKIYDMEKYGINYIAYIHPFDKGIYMIGRSKTNSTYIFFFNNSKFENPLSLFNLSKFLYYVTTWEVYFMDDKDNVYLACRIRGMDENHIAKELYTYVFILSKDGKMLKYYHLEKKLDYFYKRGDNLFVYCRGGNYQNMSEILYIINLKTDKIEEIKIQELSLPCRFLYNSSTDTIWAFTTRYIEEENLTYLKIFYSRDGIHFMEGFSYKFRGFVEMLSHLTHFQSIFYEDSTYLILYSNQNMIAKIYPYRNILTSSSYDWLIWYVDIPLLIVEISIIGIFIRRKRQSVYKK